MEGVAPAVFVAPDQAGEVVTVSREVHVLGAKAHHHVRPVHRTEHLELPVVVVRPHQSRVAPGSRRAGAVGRVEEDGDSVSHHHTGALAGTPAPTQIV